MPGFQIGGYGSGPNHKAEMRRKHRWVFETIGSFTGPQLLILKEASRPHFTFEEPEVHHDQEKIYYAGKQSWEECKLVWYDAEQEPDISAFIYQWLKTVVDLPSATVAAPSAYKVDATLKMLKNDGKSASETWTMYGCWPKDVNWNNLDYSDTEVATVEATMRYDRALRG